MNGPDLIMPAERKNYLPQIFALLLAVLFCTYLRISLLVIYPLLIAASFILFRWNFDKNARYHFPFLAFCWLLSFRNGLDLKYNLVSFYYFIPFFLLLLASPSQSARAFNVHVLLKIFAVVVAVNNVFGLTQYIIHPNDDSFTGIYGHFTVSQNGLSLLNAVLFFYFLSLFQQHRRSIYLIISSFFLICMVLGFYGAGLMAFMAALVLTFLRIRVVNILKITIICLVLVLIVGVTMKIIAPNTYDYNVAIIKIFLNSDAAHLPRKLVIFKNYFSAYTNNIADLLFGSGPGTFNSRSAFMVGSPSYFNIAAIKSEHQPFYFQNYAYTLWNPSNVGPFDGFMNQPFSSILALLGEYGLLFTAALLYVSIGRFRNVVKLARRSAYSQGRWSELQMFRFCSIFALVLIVLDNYVEYPEIIAALLIIAKTCQHRLIQQPSVSLRAAQPAA